MLYFLIFFWFIRETKAILFWHYLWQLKEYHIGRFIDHFRTEKGKRIFLNTLFFLKIFLLFLFLTTRPGLVIIYVLLVLYLFESVKAAKDFFQKRLLKPILTKKTGVLIFTGLVLGIFFIFFNWSKPLPNFTLRLLIFDILTPAITSGIILIFQPLTILVRNQIIKKAKAKRAKFKDLIVIGITGSYGKTSTKEFLATILSEKIHPVKSREAGISPKAKLFNRVKVLKTAEHQNSEVGISQCILNDLKPEHEIFIVEMGAYNRGGIKLLCDITKPKIGILTGINEQHMATFGSQENIIKTKFELIESLPEDGIAIFNGDDELIMSNVKVQMSNLNVKSKIFCSTKGKTDLWAQDIRLEKEQVSFKVFSRDGDSADFKVNLFGAQNIENILLAATVAKELGMSLKEISMACEKIKQKQSGVKLIKKTKDGLNIIDATYSANPDGVISHLEYLKVWPGKKVIVMPCLIELGKASKEVHKRIGQKIGEVCDLAIITTKERFKEIKEGAIENGLQPSHHHPAEGGPLSKENILFLQNPNEIYNLIKNFNGPNDIILLEGRVSKEIFDKII